MRGGKFAAVLTAARPIAAIRLKLIPSLAIDLLHIFFSIERAALGSLTVALLLLAGCQPDTPATTSAPETPPAAVAAPVVSPLETRVMAQHDSLMALTDRLFAFRQRLARVRAAAPAGPFAVRLDSATRATLRADDAMTDWMHAYQRPAATAAPDSAAAYFHRQLSALRLVDTLTHRALDSAAAVLRAAPQPSAK